ncbi:MAG: hypothetical protein ACREC9_05520 [Methylocella sp.]
MLKPKEGEPVPKAKPSHEEEPESAAPKTSLPEVEISPPKPSDFVGQDFGKLGVGVEKPELTIGNFDPHAIEMMAERGVSLNYPQDIVDHPLIILQQTQDKFLFLSDRGGVVVLRDGTVITTYPAANFYPRIKEILEYIHQGGPR